MRLALIPPKGMETSALWNDTQLALAQNDWLEYTEVYKRAADRSDFVIVDNGAAEGARVGHLDLMSAARRLNANEVVIPDVMGDKDKTIERFKKFFEIIAVEIDVNRFRYMGVVQGNTVPELVACAEAFAVREEVATIGIPRRLIKATGIPTIRIDTASHLRHIYGSRFSYHFLGTDRSYLRELYYVGKYHGWIRSVDTSAPYVYALLREMLPSDPKAQYPVRDRTSDYFSKDHKADPTIVSHNVGVLNAWCRGERP